METQQNTSQPPRYLSVLDVWAMAFGCMVGWGTFVMSGTTFLPVAGPAGTVIAIRKGEHRLGALCARIWRYRSIDRYFHRTCGHAPCAESCPQKARGFRA